MKETIFQHWIFTRFAFPFLLIFFIVFAVLEKTKILGEDKKQLNAIIAFVIGLIFVGVAYPTEVVGNLILFLSVALVVMFVALLLWGFVAGDIKEGFKPAGWMKIVLGILISIAVIIAVLWAAGLHNKVIDMLFRQGWSSTFWTNILFVVVVAVALTLILIKRKS